MTILARSANAIASDPRTSAQGVRWDLSSLYASPDDPAFARDRDAARQRADGWRDRWRGTIASLAPAQVGEMLAEYEGFSALLAKLWSYASLAYSVDSQNARITALLQEIREISSSIEAELSFYAVEIAALSDEAIVAWWSDPTAARLRRHIEEIRKFRKHILTEPEERLASRKDLTGRTAHAQLFDDLTNALVFPFDDGTGLKDRTAAELLSYSRHADRDLRRRAHEAFLGVYSGHGLVLAHVFNSLCLDHQVDCEMRGYPHPMTRTNMGNSVEDATVETMMAATRERYPLAQRFWRLKAKLLGLPKLANTDLYAPLGDVDLSLPWGDALGQVLQAYGSFSPELRRIAEEFRDRGWIDAEVRAGKEDGAFCSGTWPGHHPYVLLNYTGRLNDAFTLAHELGHGVHFYLSRQQPLFLYDAPLVLAETASVFGEMLLTKHLLAGSISPEVRRALLCAKIEDILATTYRQNVLTEFELAVHLARRQGLQSRDDICRIWWECNAALYGDSVEMNPAYRYGWSYIPHFIHTRFYCYAYTFGELLVLGLYQRYLEEGEAFVPRYLKLLSKGGSEDPGQACAAVGITLDRSFWDASHRFVEGLIDEFEAACAPLVAAPTVG